MNKYSAFVEFEVCTGCGNCEITCPYNAVELKEQDGYLKSAVLAERCVGCGSCVASCWNGAMQLKGSTDKDILDLIGSYSIRSSRKRSGIQEPPILTFICENCNSFDVSEIELNNVQSDSPIFFQGVSCTARLKPEFVLKAFVQHFDGVLIIGGGTGDCKFNKGSERTVKRFAILNRILGYMGFESERIKVIELSKEKEYNIKQMIVEYQEQLKLIGPNKLNFESPQFSIGKKTKKKEDGAVDNA
jgi:coenzyme F420-reducing hydrogenase delta subunit/NAD-dependent dihydropyrimidine dehydrogenase PreA subunit